MKEVVIVSAVRTPIGCFNGSLSSFSAPELGSIAIQAALTKAGISPAHVDEVIMGNVLQSGLGQNPARQAALKAGIPKETPSFTINKVCGSGLKAVMLAAQAIIAEDADIIVAGGMESMTNAPYVLEKARWGYRMGDGKLIDTLIKDGLWDAFNDYHMGVTAENIALQYDLTREEQDAVALSSQQKANYAIKEGAFTEEIIPIVVKSKKGDIMIDTDEYPKSNTTLDVLAKLRPAFSKNGTVTAGNASGINDGAAAVVVMSKEKADELGIKPLGRVISYASAGVDPSVMGLGPIPATQKALCKAKLNMDDIDLVEANEAFASQWLAVSKELRFDTEKVNVNGGAIALGHPIGASGNRILVSLLHALKNRNKKLGLATLCIGGGQGAAMVVESL